MNQASQSANEVFESSAGERLTALLSEKNNRIENIDALTPDASTRSYFRIDWNNSKAIACVYPEPIDSDTHSFIDVTNLFLAANLPVPEIYYVDEERGIIVQEDLGDASLQQVLETVSDEARDEYKSQAISLIAAIQAATQRAFDTNSIASRLAFDEEKLSWELNFFVEHYFKSLRHENLTEDELAELNAELNQISTELAAMPRVLCHRDYHAMNLMVDKQGHLHLIDYQDARMGPATYDLVSLLLDRQLESPSLAEVRECRLFLLEERRRFGLEAIDPDDFAHEFRLMTIQRCLKATGTFSFQTGIRNRGEKYLKYINPMLLISLQAAEWLGRFPKLRSMIKKRLEE
jgi:aminoglycoside/choline kinase family phosphotransferase